MKTVLFIEDNTDIRENMGEILELAGYRVLLAPDGKQGVAVALAEKPDIIVCDIMMPELDGYGVIHLLQKNESTQNIPFIFLTAKAERTEIRKGMELGADDYITKPFSGTELLNAIEGRLKKADSWKTGQQHGAPAAPATTDNRTLEQVFEACQDILAFEKKQRIYAEGHRAFRLYRVTSGRVKVYKTNEDGKDFITGICQAGEYFGYTALLEDTPYRETAEALEASEIASITKAEFESVLNDNREVMRQLVQLLAGGIQEKEEQLLGIAYNSLRKKVAGALMQLYRKYSQSTSDGLTVMNISRDNLAAMAGTAKESLIRTLGDFRDEGLIDIQGGDITILQEKKLINMLN